jgi:hypothetical protein
LKLLKEIACRSKKWGTLLGVPPSYRGIVRGKRFMIEGGLTFSLKKPFLKPELSSLFI